MRKHRLVSSSSTDVKDYEVAARALLKQPLTSNRYVLAGLSRRLRGLTTQAIRMLMR